MYSSPYQVSATPDASHANVLRIGQDFRDITLIGFDSHADNTVSFEHETVGHCVFFRPGPLHHWCSVIDDFAPTLGLRLAQSPYTSEDIEHDQTQEPSTGINDEIPPTSKNSRGKIIAICRVANNRHELIAQQCTSAAAYLRGAQHR